MGVPPSNSNMLQANSNSMIVKDSSIRVLMVDDDSDYQELCKRYLSKDSKNRYSLVCVGSAAAAIKASRCTEFDCIIIDYNLPDSVGTDVLFDLHSVLGEWMPPALVLTAGGGEEAATQAIRVNAADFLSKRDVTATSICRSIENAVKQARLKTAIRQRNKELTDAYTKLQHKTEEIRNFYHTISHEVKTPLTAIREFLSLINDEIVGPVTADQKELIGFSLESCDQISDHFNDLLDLTRLETGKLRLKRKMDSPTRLINRCTAAIAGLAENKGVELIDNSESALPAISIDSNRIAQVLSNLLNNALKHTDPGGQIQVDSDYHASNDCVYIRVHDSGCGIDDQHLNRIFDRLYQVNQNDNNESSVGLGLGLSISRELVNLHGGNLSVESQLGKGSVFTVQLSANDSHS